MAGKERKTEVKKGGGEAERKDLASSYVATVKLKEEGFPSSRRHHTHILCGGG